MSNWRDRMQGYGQVEEVRQPRQSRRIRHRDIRGNYMDESPPSGWEMTPSGPQRDAKSQADSIINSIRLEEQFPSNRLDPKDQPWRTQFPADGRLELPDGRIYLQGVGVVGPNSPYLDRYIGPGQGLAPVGGGRGRNEPSGEDEEPEQEPSKPSTSSPSGKGIIGTIGSFFKPVTDAILGVGKSPATKPAEVPQAEIGPLLKKEPATGSAPAQTPPVIPPPPNALGGGLSRWYALNPQAQPAGTPPQARAATNRSGTTPLTVPGNMVTALEGMIPVASTYQQAAQASAGSPSQSKPPALGRGLSRWHDLKPQPSSRKGGRLLA